MSSQHSWDGAMKAIESSDLARLKEALAAAERHLAEYGDVPALVQMLRIEISMLEKYRG